MAARNPLRQIPMQEAVYLLKLFRLQKTAVNHVDIDFLPYTTQVKWMVEEMLKKYPNSPWTEKLVCRTLIRMRKNALLDKSEKAEPIPVFQADDDSAENVTLKGEAAFVPEPPEFDDEQ